MRREQPMEADGQRLKEYDVELAKYLEWRIKQMGRELEELKK